MPKLILLVGPSCSGKTSLREALLSNAHDDLPKLAGNVAMISRDDIIEDWAAQAGKSYHDTFMARADEGRAAMLEQLEEAIRGRANVIWDQTNMNPATRRDCLGRVPAEYETTCIALETPYRELLRRNRLRAEETGKFIPEFVIKTQVKSYRRPKPSEGFDRICILDTEADARPEVDEELLTP